MPGTTAPVAELVITTAKLGGRALTASKVRQLDHVSPEHVAPVARIRIPKYDGRAVWVIGRHEDGRTVVSAVYRQDRPHLMTSVLLSWVPIDPDMYAAWSQLPLVLL